MTATRLPEPRGLSYRGRFTGPAEQIVRQGADKRSMSYTRDIAVRRLAGGEDGIRTGGTVCLTPRDGLLAVY
jgi:hypothetical protein